MEALITHTHTQTYAAELVKRIGQCRIKRAELSLTTTSPFPIDFPKDPSYSTTFWTYEGTAYSIYFDKLSQKARRQGCPCQTPEVLLT